MSLSPDHFQQSAYATGGSYYMPTHFVALNLYSISSYGTGDSSPITEYYYYSPNLVQPPNNWPYLFSRIDGQYYMWDYGNTYYGSQTTTTPYSVSYHVTSDPTVDNPGYFSSYPGAATGAGEHIAKAGVTADSGSAILTASAYEQDPGAVSTDTIPNSFADEVAQGVSELKQTYTNVTSVSDGALFQLAGSFQTSSPQSPAFTWIGGDPSPVPPYTDYTKLAYAELTVTLTVNGYTQYGDLLLTTDDTGTTTGSGTGLFGSYAGGSISLGIGNSTAGATLDVTIDARLVAYTTYRLIPTNPTSATAEVHLTNNFLASIPEIEVGAALVTKALAPVVPFTVVGLGDRSGIATFSDGTNSVSKSIAASGSYTVDLSGLADGPISSSLSVSEASGNTAQYAGNTVTLDTDKDLKPVLQIGNGSAGEFINASETDAVPITIGGLDDETGSVTFIDGAGAAVSFSVWGNGTYYADFSSLAPGTITSSLSVFDAAGYSANVQGNSAFLQSLLTGTDSYAISTLPTPGYSITGVNAGSVDFQDSNQFATVTASLGPMQLVATDVTGASFNLSSAQISALQAGLTLAPSSVGAYYGNGSFGWSYNATWTNQVPIPVGVTVIGTAPVQLSDPTGGDGAATITLTLSATTGWYGLALWALGNSYSGSLNLANSNILQLLAQDPTNEASRNAQFYLIGVGAGETVDPSWVLGKTTGLPVYPFLKSAAVLLGQQDPSALATAPGGTAFVWQGLLDGMNQSYFDNRVYLIDTRSTPLSNTILPGATLYDDQTPQTDYFLAKSIVVDDNNAPLVLNDGNYFVITGDVAPTITVGNGNDVIFAGDHGSTLTLGGGNDTVFGGAGKDRIIAGPGQGLLYGGGGADTFVVSGGAIEIGDFSTQDRIEIDTPNATILQRSVANGQTVLDIDTNADGVVDATVTLDGVTGSVTLAATPAIASIGSGSSTITLVPSATDTTAPGLVQDDLASVTLGTTIPITASLLQFSDDTSSDAQETYTVIAAPAAGTLLLNGAAAMSFTQANIDNGLVSYQETGNAVTSDSFAFSVTDAAGNSTSQQEFVLAISPPTDTAAPKLVNDQPLSLTEGTTGTITSTLLRFDDDTSNHPQETYTVTSVPYWGILLKSGAQATSFTQADIDNSLVTYDETVTDNQPLPISFNFTVTDAAGNITTQQTFNFTISTPSLADASAPALVAYQPLSVFAGTTTTITAKQLHYQDNISSDAQEVYTVDGTPANGVLLVYGASATSFTQADIDNGQVAYNETQPGVASDSFTFQVTDAASNTSTPYRMPIDISTSHSPDDLDGDGKSNILPHGSAGSFVDWTMNGAAITGADDLTFEGTPVGLDPSWSVAGTGDLNGDGKADILLRNPNGSFVDWTMGGSAITGADNLTFNGAVVGLDPSWSVAGTGDLNGDGKADILLRNPNGAFVDWRMGGSTITGADNLMFNGNPVSLDSSWSVLGTGDFNGDGKADILLRDTGGSFVDWTMNGLAITGADNLTFNGTAVSLDTSWSVLGTGDFDGDGKSDILLRSTDGSFVDWTMDGSAITAANNLVFQGNPVHVDSSWTFADIGDYNGDDKADILLRNANGSFAEWIMNGSNISAAQGLTFNGNPVLLDNSWKT